MTVNKERVRLLVNALRSGKFRQGRGKLAYYDKERRKVEYCCLGVACEVARANGLELARTKTKPGSSTYAYGDPERDEVSILPPSVAEWYGLDRNPHLDNGSTKATNANDTLKLNFRQIADAFEKEYLNGGE